MSHSEQLCRYMEALSVADDLGNEYLKTKIQTMIASYLRQLNRHYKQYDLDDKKMS